MVKKAVKIFLVNDKNEFLLYLRDNKPEIPYPDYWDLIGGEIEKGETSLEAIQREIKEEICIEAKSIALVGEVTVNKSLLNSCKSKVLLYKGSIYANPKDIKLTEGQKLELFRLDELKSIKIIPEFLDFILRNNVI